MVIVFARTLSLNSFLFLHLMACVCMTCLFLSPAILSNILDLISVSRVSCRLKFAIVLVVAEQMKGLSFLMFIFTFLLQICIKN